LKHSNSIDTVYERNQYFPRSAYRPLHRPAASLDAQAETTGCWVSITKDVPILRIDHISIKGMLLGVWQALYSGGVFDFKINRSLLRPQGGRMRYFRVDHPPDQLIRCNRSKREDIADYLEVNEHGGEVFTCAAHTSSERHASVLPKRVPWAETQRSRTLREPSAKVN
jgi:hypothetical protein